MSVGPVFRAADPAYPEYEQLLAEAGLRARGPVDPRGIARLQETINRRGLDWATAVLGFSYPGLRNVSVTHAELLRLADERELDPPLPASIVAARQAAVARRAELDARSEALRRADVNRWERVRAGVLVELVVYLNPNGRIRDGFLQQLAHAVPTVDVVSGVRRVRTHRAGRALCESERRARPLRLEAEPAASYTPVTCENCLLWAPKVRTSA